MSLDPIINFVNWIFFTIEFMWTRIPFLLEGAKLTVYIATAAFFLGMGIGVIMGILRVSGIGILEKIAAVYIETIRGTPLVVQVLIVYFGIPIAVGIRFDPVLAGILTMGLNSGAYQAEIVRSGIKGIPRGQLEAAESLGFTYWQSMRYVIIPQAMRIVIPAFVNEYATVLKDTSILIIIGVHELTRRGQYIAAWSYRYFEVYITIALIYLIMVLIISKSARILEKKLRIPGLGVTGARL